MKKQIYAVPMLAAAIFLAACDGKDGLDGTDGMDGMDGLNSLVSARDVPVGDAVCLGGGFAIDSGLDTNRNGVLDPNEVTSTEYTECAVTPTLRALHASPDAPAVNISIDGIQALLGVDFAAGSGFVGVGQAANVTPTGADVTVAVGAILPDGSEVDALTATLPLAFDTETTVIATDTVAGGLPLTPIVVTNPIGADIAAGSFRAQVVHSAPGAPPVDVYVTALNGPLDAPVNGAAPIAFGQQTGQLEVPEGDYQIRIGVPAAVAGDPPTVVYDSGEVALAAGADLLIVAVDNVFLGESAVQLVVMDGTGAASLLDAGTDAAAVAVHLSPDAPAVDILADIDATPANEQLVLASNLAFGDPACFIDNIPAPVDFTLSVVATGDTTSVLDIPFSSVVNEAATVVVGGYLLGGMPMIQAIPLGIDGRSVITEAKIRLTHGSASTGLVDIYLLPAGGDINAVDPDFADVAFGSDTGVLSIDPNVNYDVYVTAAGNKTPAISVVGFDPDAGSVIDIIARDVAGGLSLDSTALLVRYDDDSVADCAVP